MTAHCAAPSAARRGAPVSRCASRACTPSIATPRVKGIIGRRIKRIVNYVLPSYATRCVRGPSGQGGLPNMLFTVARKTIFLCFTSRRDCIICTNLSFRYGKTLAERAFVKVAYTPAGRLGTMINVPFAIPTEVAKQMMKWLRK